MGFWSQYWPDLVAGFTILPLALMLEALLDEWLQRRYERRFRHRKH